MDQIISLGLSLVLMVSMALTTNTTVTPKAPEAENSSVIKVITETSAVEVGNSTETADEATEAATEAEAEAVVLTPAPEIVWDEDEETILLTDGATYGEGSTSFTFVVSYMGSDVTVTVNTDAKTVGEALVDLDMIAGDDSEWGLYVKTVNGITADYNVDGSYWAFYIDGDYAMTGVDATEITEGSTYTFVVEGMDYTDETEAAEEATEAAEETEEVVVELTEATEEPAETFAMDEDGETILLEDHEVYGDGIMSFYLTVADLDGNEVNVAVMTNAETVGEALLELNIIAGDDSEWGLYVKTVNGITADYNVDGHYWAFYIDGEYAMTGVDSTPVNDGSTYAFIVE